MTKSLGRPGISIDHVLNYSSFIVFIHAIIRLLRLYTDNGVDTYQCLQMYKLIDVCVGFSGVSMQVPRVYLCNNWAAPYENRP